MIELDIIPLSSWSGVEGRPLIISGPCSAETEDQLMTSARLLKEQHIDVLRAGVWKPRTRPNAFEGVGEDGLKWLKQAKEETGLKIGTEVANPQHVELALKYGVDVLWIGARTTVNPFSVQEIADSLVGVDVPVLIKNPINPDTQLWIGAIERIYQAGIKKVAAIHRGTSSYDKIKYRNKPMWQMAIELKRLLPNIPIINDPSHIAGNRNLIFEVAQRAMDLGLDGLMIESHPNPEAAWSDAKQQVTPEVLGQILANLKIRKNTTDNVDFNHSLDDLREQIDAIDREIIEAIAGRFNLVEQIGQVKKDNNVTTLQMNRWDALLKDRKSKAEKLGLDMSFVGDIYNLIHKESIRVQSEIMNKK